jgi:hypothetical protein
MDKTGYPRDHQRTRQSHHRDHQRTRQVTPEIINGQGKSPQRPSTDKAKSPQRPSTDKAGHPRDHKWTRQVTTETKRTKQVTPETIRWTTQLAKQMGPICVATGPSGRVVIWSPSRQITSGEDGPHCTHVGPIRFYTVH